jgi:hypothetical protein
MISLRSTAGKPIPIGAVSVTPVARWWRIRWPGGGIAWTSPLEVVIEKVGTAPRIEAVPDVTRRLQVALLAIGAGTALLLRLARTGGKRR